MRKVDLNDRFGGFIVPQDINLQREVLTACLNGHISTVMDYISIDEVFLGNEYLNAYKAMKKSYLENGKVTILNILKASKDSHLTSLISTWKEMPFNEREIIPYCLRLIELYIGRETIKICSDTVEAIYTNDSMALDSCLKLIDTQKDLSDSILNNRTETFNETKENVIMDIFNRMTNLETSVISTGIYDIDEAIGGLEIGSVNIVGARPGMGKTALTIQLIYNVGFVNRKPILAFNLEMTKEELVKRLLALHTKSGNFEMRSGFFGNEKRFEQFKKDSESFVSENIFLIDNVYNSDEIMRIIRKFKDTKNIELCIIDYIQLVGGSGGYREQEVSKISRQMKMSAKINRLPILALAQLSREVEKRGGDCRPRLSDLRESGSIEQDADMVLMLYRAEKYNIMEDEAGNSTVGIMEILCLKHRNGMPDITIPVKYEPKYNMIETINKKPTPVPSKPIQLGVQQSIDTFESEVKLGSIENVKIDF